MSSPEDVTELVRCPDCGRLVPAGNLVIHQAHACAARKRPARNDRTVEGDDVQPMDIDSSSPPSSPLPSAPIEPETIDLSSPPRASVPAVARLPSPPPPWTSLSDSLRQFSQNLTATLSPERRNHAKANPSSSSSTRECINLADDDDEEEEEPHWTCPRCTLSNAERTSTCEACLYHRPQAQQQRPPDATRREQLIREVDGLPVYQQPSTGQLLSGGALIGSVLGAAGAYVRGRPVGSAALEGAMNGAVSGAIVGELLGAQQQPQRPILSRHRSAPALAQSRTASQPRPSLRVVQRRLPNGRLSTMVISTTGGGMTGRDYQVRELGGDATGIPQLDYMMQSILASRLNTENMSYEQLLAAFGNGTEHLSASDEQIAALPSAVIENPQELSEDRRQCCICLEDFAAGDTRTTLPCLHCYHQACIAKWLRTNGACPICKHRLER